MTWPPFQTVLWALGAGVLFTGFELKARRVSRRAAWMVGPAVAVVMLLAVAAAPR